MQLFDNFKEFNDRIALFDENQNHITYKELEKISHFFKNNVNKRSLFFLLANNTIGSISSYISLIKNKHVSFMFDIKIEIDFLINLIKLYNPNYILVPKEHLSHLPYSNKVFDVHNYLCIEISKKKIDLYENLALLLSTSGTTGSPKFIRISYENLEVNASSIAKYLSININERPITTLPMSYSFGLSIINSHLIKGATILLTSKSLMEKEFWSFLNNQKATSLSGVPYTFEMLKKLRFFHMDLPFLTTLTQAGGKMSNDLNREIAELCLSTKKRLFVMYGQTEASPRMSYLPHEHSLSKLGSIGIAIPGGKFSLINKIGKTIIENNVEGELVYRGKNVSLGYAESGKDLSKGNENKGILFTGDIAKRDNKGFYYIVGRKKRFVKIFGNRINLDDIERLLKNVVSECACVGNDDQMIIYISDEAKKDKVFSFLSKKIGINHSAFSIRFIDTIPKNSSGKTIYSSLDL